MSEDKKPSKEIIGKAYDKIANEVRHKGGINPYAYRLGFVDGWVAAASPVSDAVELINNIETVLKSKSFGEVSFSWYKEQLLTKIAVFKSGSPTPTNVQEQGL